MKRQVEGNEMTLSSVGSENTVHPCRSFLSCGPGTFQWTEDHLVGPNFYLKIDNQVYSPLTVAYFVIDSFFFFFCLTVSGRGNRKI